MTGSVTTQGRSTGPPVDDLVAPIVRRSWCMGPVRSSLAADDLVSTEGNRWSALGEPTVYLARDPGVAIAEFGRHWTDDLEAAAMSSVEFRLERALDLRQPDVRRILDIAPDPTWVLDRNRCRSIARELRAAGTCDGLLVPSAAFVDDDSRWNAVIFVDRLARPLADVLRIGTPTYRLAPSGHGRG